MRTLESTTVNLVVTDIRMPGRSGVELAVEIEKLHPDVLIAFMTGYSEYEALATAITLRPFGFLEKPFSPAALIDLAERARLQFAGSSAAAARTVQLETAVADKSRDLEFQTERLPAETEQLHGIVSCANFGLIAIDTNRTIHLVNAQALKLLAVGNELAHGCLGLPVQDILPAQHRSSFDELFSAISREPGVYRREAIIEANDSKVEIVAYPIKYRENITALVFIIHDITETEMLQRRLIQTAKLASIGELAAGVAHEINNPLGFVTSNCNTLQKYLVAVTSYIEEVEGVARTKNEPPSADACLRELRTRYDVDYIQEDAGELIRETLDGLARVSKIVRDLKTFARADSDSPQEGNVNNLLDDALNLVRNEIKYSLEVVRKYSTVPNITCYPSQLVQVFTNMFVNASQAIKGKGTLTIATVANERTLRVSIGDTGEGIAEKDLARIFDPFYTTKPPGKGTGMGLSISYGIIQKHGGTIRVSSVLGEGTEFTIDLPLQLPVVSCAPSPESQTGG